jgi:hypothetical protein
MRLMLEVIAARFYNMASLHPHRRFASRKIICLVFGEFATSFAIPSHLRRIPESRCALIGICNSTG